MRLRMILRPGGGGNLRSDDAYSPLVFDICQRFKSAGYHAVLVGGCVRDTLLGYQAHDCDIEVFGAETLDDVKVVIDDMGPVSMVGRSYQVLKLKVGGQEFDLSLPRRDVKLGVGHRGFEAVSDASMSFKEAASRRDFTINAMGFDPLTTQLLDPFGGQQDLENKRLRHVSDAFAEDPLRALRAVQFVARFDLTIDADTAALCRTLELTELSKERIFGELSKLLLLSKRPSIGFNVMTDTGVISLFKELATLGPLWHDMLNAVDKMAKERNARLVLMLSAMCYFLTEEATKALLKRLTSDTDLKADVVALTRACRLLPIERMSDADIRQLSTWCVIDDVVLLANAVGKPVPGLNDRAQALGVLFGPMPALILGRHVLESGVLPGPEVGRWVKAAYKAQIAGEFGTEAEGVVWLRSRL
jgi:tRNA nucleotidyltransferase (CCA-adding enzyme)